MTQDHIVLFDGVCNLCGFLVRFIVRRDPAGKFRFCALQSESGQTILEMAGLSPHDVNSVVFITGHKYYMKSTAVLEILKKLGCFWQFFYILIIIPRPIRDFIYDIVAKTRYRMFGKRDSCHLPEPLPDSPGPDRT